LHTKPEAAKVKTNAATGVPACVLFPIAQNEPITNPGFGYNALALQGWLILCCQLKHGGLQDKPGKGRDHYHTCYCLSGLSAAQHFGGDGILGPATNLLEKLNPVVNVVETQLVRWMRGMEKTTG